MQNWYKNNNKVKDVRAKKLPSQRSSTSSPATVPEKQLLVLVRDE
jgi:hypothetical protein